MNRDRGQNWYEYYCEGYYAYNVYDSVVFFLWISTQIPSTTKILKSRNYIVIDRNSLKNLIDRVKLDIST